MNNLVAPEDFPEEEESASTDMEIVSREDAKNLGLRRYFTGEPCKRGHIAERMVNGKACVECSRERDKERRSDPHFREKEKERDRKYQRERRLKGLTQEYQKEWRRKKMQNKEWRRKKNAHQSKRYANDLNYRVKFKMRASINKLKDNIKAGKLEGSSRYLNYTVEELVEHLEKTIDTFYRLYPRSKWPEKRPLNIVDALDKGWHVDHIRPITEFFTEKDKELTEEECIEIVREANDLKNLRLVPARFNHERGSDVHGLDRLHYAGIDYIPDDLDFGAA